MFQAILILNCGSSSIKFQLFDHKLERTLLVGLAENIGGDVGFKYQTEQSNYKKNLGALSYAEVFAQLVPVLQEVLGSASLIAIGHRVVHGGNFTQPVIINEQILNQIKNCTELAPLHNPANILGIECAQQAFPQVPQVAVFDTAFHQTLPDYAYTYGLPKVYEDKYQVRRYGFHGISYQYLFPEAARILQIPLENSAFIAAHLGNGASVCAALNGKSVDTSMGLTPLEGLLMGTRCGDLDPGLFEYLTRCLKISAQELTSILNKQSGMLGVSGLSNDMRQLEAAAAEGNQQAQLTIEIFCYRLAKYIAAYIVPLGRLDGLIFSGGIGENSSMVREKVLNRLSFLGFKLAVEQNKLQGAETRGIITEKDSKPALVIKTQEERMIAIEAFKLVA
ncbi:MAG: acetate/propionate kinase [Gammaproteobacteria bacterium]|jgi:acetate kinase|nr:acetate/propionate kinase [Gammaproteobacteria bacterium]